MKENILCLRECNVSYIEHWEKNGLMTSFEGKLLSMEPLILKLIFSIPVQFTTGCFDGYYSSYLCLFQDYQATPSRLSFLFQSASQAAFLFGVSSVTGTIANKFLFPKKKRKKNKIKTLKNVAISIFSDKPQSFSIDQQLDMIQSAANFRQSNHWANKFSRVIARIDRGESSSFLEKFLFKNQEYFINFVKLFPYTHGIISTLCHIAGHYFYGISFSIPEPQWPLTQNSALQYLGYFFGHFCANIFISIFIHPLLNPILLDAQRVTQMFNVLKITDLGLESGNIISTFVVSYGLYCLAKYYENPENVPVLKKILPGNNSLDEKIPQEMPSTSNRANLDVSSLPPHLSYYPAILSLFNPSIFLSNNISPPVNNLFWFQPNINSFFSWPIASRFLYVDCNLSPFIFPFSAMRAMEIGLIHFFSTKYVTYAWLIGKSFFSICHSGLVWYQQEHLSLLFPKSNITPSRSISSVASSSSSSSHCSTTTLSAPSTPTFKNFAIPWTQIYSGFFYGLGSSLVHIGSESDDFGVFEWCLNIYSFLTGVSSKLLPNF